MISEDLAVDFLIGYLASVLIRFSESPVVILRRPILCAGSFCLHHVQQTLTIRIPGRYGGGSSCTSGRWQAKVIECFMRLLAQGILAAGGLVTLHAQFLDGGGLHEFVVTNKLVTPLLKVELVPLLNGRLTCLGRSLTVY